MIGHILPCVLEAELLTVLAYLVAHASDAIAVLKTFIMRSFKK